MKNLFFTIVFFAGLFLIANSAHAAYAPAKIIYNITDLNRLSDTSAFKKYNNISLNSIRTNKKFSLNVKKEVEAPAPKLYNNFDIKSKKPSFIESVLMRKGNSIQAIPLYRYTLPF